MLNYLLITRVDISLYLIEKKTIKTFLKSFKRLKNVYKESGAIGGRWGPLGSIEALRGHGAMLGGRRPQMKFSPAGIVEGHYFI